MSSGSMLLTIAVGIIKRTKLNVTVRLVAKPVRVWFSMVELTLFLIQANELLSEAARFTGLNTYWIP